MYYGINFCTEGLLPIHAVLMVVRQGIPDMEDSICVSADREPVTGLSLLADCLD
jgi:hypothetical protein